MNYAEVVKAAASTIIIREKADRTTEEVRQQVLIHSKDHHGNAKNVRKIRNEVKIMRESDKAARELKKTITEDQEVNKALEIKNASLRKK